MLCIESKAANHNACKCSLHRNGFHLDHIIPLAKGGTNFEGNVQLLLQTMQPQKENYDAF